MHAEEKQTASKIYESSVDLVCSSSDIFLAMYFQLSFIDTVFQNSLQLTIIAWSCGGGKCLILRCLGKE